MPLFISDDELSHLSNNGAAVAERADAYIRQLNAELETVKARNDADLITSEQTCSLIEHKYVSLSTEFEALQVEKSRIQSSLDDRLAELAQVQAHKHQLHLQSIAKDGELEKVSMEVSELHKSKRQLIQLMEQKDLEITEKNASMKIYLDKIVSLTERAAQKEARCTEIETDLTRAQSACTRLSQEKELIERHNAWLNDELTAKVESLTGMRRTLADLEADMSAKLADSERKFEESSSSLKWNKERVRELETKILSLQEELCSTKDAAAASEEQLSAELSTVNKLVELYKKSSEEWSRKAGELEGVIKALETHTRQIENDYKERLENEVSSRKQLENEAADLKGKLQRCEGEIESMRKSYEQNILPLSSFTSEKGVQSLDSGGIEDNRMLVPHIPVGVSGTALAASLLRDGWSLVKMYTKYQEAVDAFRHEQLGRKEAEDVLHRVLAELEEKAGVIMDERAEHDRMADAYSLINQKLQQSISEQATLEKNIQELKAVMRRHERDNCLAQKEIVDLQNQVAVLLKECRDIQLRCGSTDNDYPDNGRKIAAIELNTESGAETIISERLLTFKDINGLVEQNVQLRSLVRSLSDQIESRETEFKVKLEMELKKHKEEATCKVDAVLQRAEEQGHMIESLHSSVAMYKRLYEEEHKLHLDSSRASNIAPANGRADLVLLVEGSQEASKKAQEKAAERVKYLEEELEKSRSEIITLRSERDKFALQATFAREKLDGVMKEVEHKRSEINGVLARNVEFSQLIVDYQRKLRESAESLTVVQDHSRKLTMEVSILKHEKEMLSNAEKRACDEVRSLSERLYRLQASLDTIQSADEVREEARSAERRKQEEYIKQREREWAEARKELQEERENVRKLTSDREHNLKDSLRQVDEMGKELANALRAVAAAETRAAVAEAKLLDLGKKTKSSGGKINEIESGCGLSSLSANEVVEPQSAKEELVKVIKEAQANKEHMQQYKSIAEVNESALKQMELAHESFKIEAEKLKDSLEAELLLLRERVSLLENESVMKSKEVASATAGKEEALTNAVSEIGALKEQISVKSSQIASMEVQVSALKEDLEKEHEKWRTAQANYERQVILQSETIQELTKTSQALSSLHTEASELRKLADTYKSENNELKAKWEMERSILEKSQREAEKKFDEVNQQNKTLLNRLETWHIQLAEKERGISSSNDPDHHRDAGLQDVISYLRRSNEIAETEISLLKQERLRMKSQLESALRSAETAQASLNTERANSRAFLFTDEEIKNLQSQVSEINLLRESNMQLREENKFNFEECQKSREIAQIAKAEADKLERLLGEREIQIEGCKKEIEMLRREKENLDQRISELLERSKNIDVEDYARLKNDIQQIEQKLKEKDVHIEELESLVSKKQETMSQLEQDIANSRLVISEHEKRINELSQGEASLKAEIERHKRMVAHFKRRCETIMKEKEEISKENQALSKQLEELKQEKRSRGDISVDQTMKEKQEKDHRIQILEKHVERFRDQWTKEKEKRQNTEKAISDSVNNVTQAKNKVLVELEKYKQALKRLSDELEKLKVAAGSLPEGTSLVQLLSGSTLDDLATAFISAVENFERVAQSINSELAVGAPPLDLSSVADASQMAAAAQMVSAPSPAVRPSASLAVTHSPAKATEEKERRLNLPKPAVETRKVARRIVRPRLAKPDQPQVDVDMSDATAPSQDTELHKTTLSHTQPPLRKRPSVSGVNEQSQIQGESSVDVAAPVPKKAKASITHAENTEGELAQSDNLAVEEQPSDTGDDLPLVDTEKEVVGEVALEKKDSNVSEEVNNTDEMEPQSDNMEETSDKPIEIDVVFDDDSSRVDKSGQEENKQLAMELEEGECEEGELEPDEADIEGGDDVSNVVEESPEITAGHADLHETPAMSPSRIDDDDAPLGIEVSELGEVKFADEEKDDEKEEAEETAEDSGSDDGLDQVTMENDQLLGPTSGTGESSSTSNQAETDVPKQDDGPNKEIVETQQMTPEVPKQDDDPNKEIVETQQMTPEVPKQDSDPNKAVVETQQMTPEVAPSNETASTSSAAGPGVSKQGSSNVTAGAEEVSQVSPVSGGASSTVVNLQERARQRAALRQAGGLAPATPTRGRGRPAGRGRGVRGRGVCGGRGPTTTPGQQG